MKKLWVVSLSMLIFLTACLPGDDDKDGTNGKLESTNVDHADENEFVVSVTPAHESTGVSISTTISVTFTEDFPVEHSELAIEMFGFPVDEDCKMNTSGFICGGANPINFDDIGFEGANAWHSDPVVNGSTTRLSVDYEILIGGDPSSDGDTVTFNYDGGALSENKNYVVHLFGGKVLYSDQDPSDEPGDFRTWWVITTGAD